MSFDVPWLRAAGSARFASAASLAVAAALVLSLGGCAAPRVGLGTPPDATIVPDHGLPDAAALLDATSGELGAPDADGDSGGPDDAGPGDASAADAAEPGDAGPVDGGRIDAGGDGGAADLGGPDAGRPDPVVQVAAGFNFSCARTAGGRVFCWGANANGQLGDGTTMERRVAVAVEGLDDAIDLAAGGVHACAVRRAGGAVVCWGANAHGQSSMSAGDQRAPAPAGGGVAGATRVAAGATHSCALRADGRAVCWGRNNKGQLARSGGDSAMAVDLGIRGVSVLAAGAEHTCAIGPDALVRCAGENADRQLGDGTTMHRAALGPVMMLTRATAVGARGATSCALAESASTIVACWGDNASGQLADTTTTDSSAPRVIPELASPTQVAVGGLHVCARLGTGTLRCWGNGGAGRLGNGGTSDARAPVDVMGLSDVTDVAAGTAHTCAVAGGAAYCWGTGADGRLGDGATIDRTTPVRVVGLP
jgi:alpha-tubulin suppressor-like RCC1 family protein